MRNIYLTLIFFILTSPFLFGQSLFDNLTSEAPSDDAKKTSFELSGFARGVVQGGAKDFDYSNAFGEFALKGRFEKQKAFLYADMRVREGIFYNNRELQLQLKEAYAGYRGDKIDLFLGNQIVTWGRTDGFNPTNNITPNDYFLLTYEPDDQKLSNFMLRTKIKPSNTVDIELIAIPFYKPSVYRYELFDMGQFGFFDLSNAIYFDEVDSPKLRFDKGSLAARLNLETSSVSLAASYFIGHNPFYGFTLDNFTLSPLAVNFMPKPYFMQTIGADFALPVKSWIIRGEMALNLTKDYEVAMNIPNPDLSYVVGIERSFWDIMAIFQYVGKYTFNFKELKSPMLTGFTLDAIQQYATDMALFESTKYNRKIFNQQEETNHMLFLSLNRSFFYEQLNVELSGAYNITTEEHLVRSRVKWNLTDAVSANIGCNFMLGPDESIFHLAGNVMNGVFLGLEVGF
ncbi:MAG TPA: hypothetical protein DG754_04100 [Bacteroidales bacterium]|jgi:hypothetical protein|nr:hypothetical protein [Bacteroidales bacterium]